MNFPDPWCNASPDNCVGQEAHIIDLVEKHFVIENIDKIRFQNEIYHIKQFLHKSVKHEPYGGGFSFNEP